MKALQRASSPEDTEIFLTKILNVPKITIELISINLGLKSFFKSSSLSAILARNN
jgi:hypothetical protein